MSSQPASKCVSCGRRPANAKGPGRPDLCGYCRRALAKPIDTICAGCGEAAHALFCNDCARPLVERGKALVAQEKYNQARSDRRTPATNPRYSSGAFPGWDLP